MRPSRLREDSVTVPSPAIVNPAVQNLTGAIVYDCRPRLLPVSIRLNDCLHPSGVQPAASASLAAPPAEETMMLGSTGPERATLPEFAVAISDDSGTDLEDELLRFYLLPTVVSPLAEPDAGLPVSPSLYLEPPIPELPDPTLTSILHFAPLPVVNELPTIDLFPSYTISPAHSYYDLETSPVTSDIPDAYGYLSLRSPAAMDRYLAEDGDLLLDGRSDLPLLPLPLLPVTRSQGGQLPSSSAASPDLSREGPFDANLSVSESEIAPLVLDNLPGCQYRMTSYENAGMTVADPEYGLQLHHPRFLEYVGAPASARLLSHLPGYWLHHMDREQTVSAALQLQHDAGLMMSNLQVLGQFVTSLNRMSSEVMRLAFDQEPYPS